MKTLKQLNGISSRLTELLEDLDMIMDDIQNSELYSELDNNTQSLLTTALTNLDIAIDDVADGMYEDFPVDEEDLDWD